MILSLLILLKLKVLESEYVIVEEMKAFHKNETWDLIQKLANVNIITCKWIYKVKCKLDGSIDCYKARFTTRGFFNNMKKFEETSVAKMTSMVITLTSNIRLKL